MNDKQIAALIAAIVKIVKDADKPQHKPISSYKAANKNQHVKAKTDKVLSDGRTKRQLANDVAVGKAFLKIGLHVTPRVDALTYKAWLSKGFRVIPKERGLFVKGVGTLFHSGQVAPDVQPSKAEMRAEVANLSQADVEFDEGIWVS